MLIEKIRKKSEILVTFTALVCTFLWISSITRTTDFLTKTSDQASMSIGWSSNFLSFKCHANVVVCPLVSRFHFQIYTALPPYWFHLPLYMVFPLFRFHLPMYTVFIPFRYHLPLYIAFTPFPFHLPIYTALIPIWFIHLVIQHLFPTGFIYLFIWCLLPSWFI